jgi:hypothetical protein
MDETQLRLDGNAAAGLMREMFVNDMTAARGACATCGNVAAMGSRHLYHVPAPGAVLRRSRCEAVLLVVVHTGDRYRLGRCSLTWLEVMDPLQPAVRC